MDDVCGIDTGFSPFPVWSGVPGTAARCEAYQIFMRWQDGRCFTPFPVDKFVDNGVENGAENAPRWACVRGLPVFPALDCLPVRVCSACSRTGEKRLRQRGAGCRFVPLVCPASGFASVHAMPSLCALPENGMIMPCFSKVFILHNVLPVSFCRRWAHGSSAEERDVWCRFCICTEKTYVFYGANG